jgi:hypothetical protein
MAHTDYLSRVTGEDVRALLEAERHYGSSWKKRGGVGAFMMLARKWDRLENALSSASAPWDIFAAAEADQRTEGIIDDIRDLRRYLVLVEAELMDRGVVATPQDTETQAMAAWGGGAGVGESPTEEEQLETRHQRHLTNFEYQNYGQKTIRNGSMAGRKVSELYEGAGPGANTVHPYVMKEEYVAEYSL